MSTVDVIIIGTTLAVVVTAIAICLAKSAPEADRLHRIRELASLACPVTDDDPDADAVARGWDAAMAVITDELGEQLPYELLEQALLDKTHP